MAESHIDYLFMSYDESGHIIRVDQIEKCIVDGQNAQLFIYDFRIGGCVVMRGPWTQREHIRELDSRMKNGCITGLRFLHVIGSILMCNVRKMRNFEISFFKIEFCLSKFNKHIKHDRISRLQTHLSYVW